MLEIKGVVKHASWGGLHHIPLMTSQNHSNIKCSEYLFTGTPSDTVRLIDSSNFCDWLKAAPETRLGVPGVEAFGCNLPFSIKLVDVNIPRPVCLYPGPLDIEVDRNSQTRTLRSGKEKNHLDAAGQKNVIIAVSEVVLLSGFLSKKAILEKLSCSDMFSEIRDVFKQFGLKGGLSFILKIDESFASYLIKRVYEAYRSRFENSEISTQDNLYWFLESVKYRLAIGEKLRSDIFLMLFMKVQRVKPRDVVYIESGCAFTVLNGFYFEFSSPLSNTITPTSQSSHWPVEFLKQVDVSKGISFPLVPEMTDERTADYRVEGCFLKVTSFKLIAEELLTIPNQEFPSLWIVAKGEVMFNTQQHYSYTGSALYQRPQEFNTLVSTHESFVYRFSVQVD